MRASMLILLSTLLLPFFTPKDSLVLFRRWCRSSSPELRIQAVRTLRGRAGREARAALLSMLADDHPSVRAAARVEVARRPAAEGPELAREIGALRDPAGRLEGLLAVLDRREDPTAFARDRDPEVRRRALFSGRVAPAVARQVLDGADPVSRALALEVLREPELAHRRLRDPAPEVRIAVCRIAGAAETVVPLLRDRSWRVRLAAILACERLRGPAAVPGLIRMLETENGRLRHRAVDALEGLTGAPFGADAGRWKRWWAGAQANFVVPDARPPRPRGHTTAVATFRRIPVVARGICFVLDASRSMGKPAPNAPERTRWDLVVSDLLDVVAGLPPGARFNVVLFRTEPERWRPRLVPATPGARRACERWIAAARPAGWTNLFDALALALEDDDVEAVYVLTDGVPSRGRETKRRAILEGIDYLNRYRLVQINCVQAGAEKGLGKSWRGFLDELAKAHDGTCVRE